MTMYDGTFSLENNGIVQLSTLESTITVDVVRYMGEWIAISGGEVVAHSPHLVDLLDETEELDGTIEYQYITYMMLWAGRSSA